MARLSRGEGAALLDRFRRYLRDRRLPVTRQREILAEIVLLSDDHLSAEAIRGRLRERGERVSTATVYRTLDLLVASGLARAHDFGQGFRRFESMPAQAHHEHLVCSACGRVTEFANERLERILPVIADEHGFRHEHHRVEVFGVCRECQHRDLGDL